MKLCSHVLDEIYHALLINSIMYSFKESDNDCYKNLLDKDIINIVYKIILLLLTFYENIQKTKVNDVPLFWTLFLVLCKINEYGDIKILTKNIGEK